MEETALYLHIPFCRKKCPYCNFYSITQGFEETVYLSALKKEIFFWKERFNIKIKTFYAGGGTPSLLSPKFYESLFEILSKDFDFAPLELTLEANPETLSLEKLKAFRAIGFNRISLGVQSLTKKGLKFLGRIHSVDKALKAIDWFNKANFENFSLDFIYDWKGQGLKTLEKELKLVLSLTPSHLSFYELTLEEGTPMRRIYKKKSWSSEKKVGALCKLIEDTLEGAGYERYEISNYALPGKKCLHNRFYWEVKPYLGIGAGAVSRIGKYRWKNPENYFFYTSQLIEKGAPPFEIVEVWDKKEWAKEYIFMGLRLKEGIKISFLTKKGYSFSHNALKLLEKYDFIHKTGGRVFLSFKGKLLHNRIAAFLWDNLEELKK